MSIQTLNGSHTTQLNTFVVVILIYFPILMKDYIKFYIQMLSELYINQLLLQVHNLAPEIFCNYQRLETLESSLTSNFRCNV